LAGETHPEKAADSICLCENLEEDHPVGLYFGNLRTVVRRFGVGRKAHGGVAARHDQKVFKRSKPIDKDIVSYRFKGSGIKGSPSEGPFLSLAGLTLHRDGGLGLFLLQVQG